MGAVVEKQLYLCLDLTKLVGCNQSRSENLKGKQLVCFSSLQLNSWASTAKNTLTKQIYDISSQALGHLWAKIKVKPSLDLDVLQNPNSETFCDLSKQKKYCQAIKNLHQGYWWYNNVFKCSVH